MTPKYFKLDPEGAKAFLDDLERNGLLEPIPLPFHDEDSARLSTMKLFG